MTSPQVTDIEEALARVEDQVVSTLAGMLTAYATGVGLLDAYEGWQPVNNALTEALVPFVAAQLDEMQSRSVLVAALGGYNSWAAAKRAVRRALFHARKAVQNFRLRDRDIYDTSQSTTYDQARSHATRLVRATARTALFSGQQEVADVTGATHKRWVSVGDERVRPAHAALDGDVVSITESFVTQQGTIRFPGDVTASPGLWINCRCGLEMLRRPGADMVE